MKDYSLAFKSVGLSVAAWLSPWLAPPSAAQEAAVWTHPSGLYWLDYGSVGWKIGKAFSYGGKQALAVFEPRKGNKYVDSCLVFETALNLPAVADQTGANNVISRYTAEEWATQAGYDPDRVKHFSNEMAGNFRVATMVVDATTPGPIRSFYRAVVIFKRDGAFHQELSCKIGAGASSADVNQVLKFLDSLRFQAAASG